MEGAIGQDWAGSDRMGHDGIGWCRVASDGVGDGVAGARAV